jgi:leucyl-tRNA synthetase
MVPHMCEELWHLMGNRGSITLQAWPVYDPEAAHVEEIEIVIQVNGKLRGKTVVAADASADEIKAKALACQQIGQWLQDKEVKKVIVAPGKLGSKLVSIVVA